MTKFAAKNICFMSTNEERVAACKGHDIESVLRLSGKGPEDYADMCFQDNIYFVGHVFRKYEGGGRFAEIAHFIPIGGYADLKELDEACDRFEGLRRWLEVEPERIRLICRSVARGEEDFHVER